jgi:putative ABC transport system permease protein
MPGASYVTVVPLQEMIEPQIRGWRSGATMFVAFATLALTIAGVGLYSAIAYGVAQRRQEIGVRLALGAPRVTVIRLVIRGSLTVVIGGVAIGTIISLWAGRWIAPLLFDESSRDPVVYAIVAATLIAVGLVSSALPALAASRVDPNAALRAQ